MAGVDVDVKDLMLLLSYQSSFQSAMSSIDGQFNFASILLNGLVDDYTRQITNSIHTIVGKRKQGLYGAKTKLAAATMQSPPDPKTIALAAKKYEHCKEAYELALKTEKKCEELVKQLRIKTEQAKEQVRKYQSDVKDKSSGAISYLGDYRTALNKYKEQNGFQN